MASDRCEAREQRHQARLSQKYEEGQVDVVRIYEAPRLESVAAGVVFCVQAPVQAHCFWTDLRVQHSDPKAEIFVTELMSGLDTLYPLSPDEKEAPLPLCEVASLLEERRRGPVACGQSVLAYLWSTKEGWLQAAFEVRTR